MAQQINLFEVMPETNQFRRIYGLLIELQEHKLVMKARGEKIVFTSNYNIKEMLHSNIIAGFVRRRSDNKIFPLPLTNQTHNLFEEWMARDKYDPNFDVFEHPKLKHIMEQLADCKTELVQYLQNFKRLYDANNEINIEQIVKSLFPDLHLSNNNTSEVADTETSGKDENDDVKLGIFLSGHANKCNIFLTLSQEYITFKYSVICLGWQQWVVKWRLVTINAPLYGRG